MGKIIHRSIGLLMLGLAGCAQIRANYAPYPDRGNMPEHGSGDSGGGSGSM